MTKQEYRSKVWSNMIARSFHPRQWFTDGDAPGTSIEDCLELEGTIMWVYRKITSGMWVTGFYSPDRQWHDDHEYKTQQEAAARVHYLNGGGTGGGESVPQQALRQVGAR